MFTKLTGSLVVLFLLGGAAVAAVADFENLPLAANSFSNGDPGGLLPGQSRDGSFISGGAKFNNRFAVDADFGFPFWNGWAYSNKTDTTTPGFANQYSAFAGGGSGGSAIYGIAFMGIPEPVIELPAGAIPVSIDVTNSTYAAHSMLAGDAFAKKFGDDPATVGMVETNFPDFFKLSIGGMNAAGQTVGSPIDVYLADYRFAGDAQDFVQRTWRTVDLAPLAGAAKLTFALESSDIGPFGANTPLYFAADNLVFNVIPEPSGLLLALAALAAVAATRWLKPSTRARDLTQPGWSRIIVSIPRRIVCLSAETVDLLYRLGADELIVGVSGFARFPPAARSKIVVSGFTTIRYETIEALQPDLIIGFSDLQAAALCELAKRGYPVLLTNQRTLPEMFATLVMIGRIVDKAEEATALARDLQSQLDRVRQNNRRPERRPKVYFEEWDDPLISGIAWVGELIEAVGGNDVFPELSRLRSASERIVQCHAVPERSPDIIVASWCGKPADLKVIRARPGWEAIPAVRHNHLYEIPSDYCLQPGPALITEALPRIEAIINDWRARPHNP